MDKRQNPKNRAIHWVSIRAMLLVVCLPGLAQASTKVMPIAIPVALAAEGLYASMMGITVAGTIAFHDLPTIELPNRSVIYKTFSGAAQRRSRLAAETERRLSALRASYITLKHMLEDFEEGANGIEALSAFHAPHRAACSVRGEGLNCDASPLLNLLSRLDAPASSHRLLSASSADASEMNFEHSLIQDFIEETLSLSRENCDPKKGLEHFKDLGYRVRGPVGQERIPTMQGFASRSADSIVGRSTREFWHVYKGGKMLCTFMAEVIDFADGFSAWSFALLNAQIGRDDLKLTNAFSAKINAYLSGRGKDPTGFACTQKNCDKMRQGDPCKSLYELFLD